ncbi:transglycosylase SLT domain-containing protein [Shewanella mangrovi]|uniref:transglycosylase SLT domain-containing protein n=1 Tax=Shewanella mangrovi TaxID=1515746 RepID=UPI00068A6A70|nr:transglycosylase SLT domain-containing protein [Shewanella mangrovi]
MFTCLLVLLCQGVFAQESKERVFRYEDANGVVVFSDQQPKNQSFEVLLYDCYACNPDSKVDWHNTPLFTEQYRQEISLAAKQHQLDPALIRAVIHAESAFNPAARSRTGAVGLMQLMPATAKEVGVSNRYNPSDNIEGGSRYLAELMQRFHGNMQLACAAYNAGPTLVSQLGAVPDYPETQSYVERVQILWQRYRQQ